MENFESYKIFYKTRKFVFKAIYNKFMNIHEFSSSITIDSDTYIYTYIYVDVYVN